MGAQREFETIYVYLQRSYTHCPLKFIASAEVSQNSVAERGSRTQFLTPKYSFHSPPDPQLSLLVSGTLLLLEKGETRINSPDPLGPSLPFRQHTQGLRQASQLLALPHLFQHWCLGRWDGELVLSDPRGGGMDGKPESSGQALS